MTSIMLVKSYPIWNKVKNSKEVHSSNKKCQLLLIRYECILILQKMDLHMVNSIYLGLDPIPKSTDVRMLGKAKNQLSSSFYAGTLATHCLETLLLMVNINRLFVF